MSWPYSMVLKQNDAYKTTFGNPTPNAEGAIVASMPAGSLVGALAVTALADIFGRKKTIILSGWIWVIGSILQCASIVSAYFPKLRMDFQLRERRTAVCSSQDELYLVYLSVSPLPLSPSINRKSLPPLSVAAWSRCSNGMPRLIFGLIPDCQFNFLFWPGLLLGVSCCNTLSNSVAPTLTVPRPSVSHGVSR